MNSTHQRSHLQAAGIASFVACVSVAFLLGWFGRLEGRYVHILAPELSDLKLQGVALQKAAFAQEDLLVLYGSSELVKEVPNRAVDFFEEYPTGFRVFPVGKAGTVSLNILQKLAAVGGDLRGRKVAFSLSPSFFFTSEVNEDYYEGNFSALQAQELAYSSVLSHELKRDSAKRMLHYDDTLDGNWTLNFALDRLVGDSFVDHALYAAMWPLGKLSNAVGRAQDHVEAGIRIIAESDDAEVKHAKFAGINWKDVFRRSDEQAKKLIPKPAKLVQRPKGARDASFIADVLASDEWDDFELILRTLKELGAEPLLVSMPLHGPDLEITGVSAKARHTYGEKLAALAGRYAVKLVYFNQYEEDPSFFADHQDHPGVKGWVRYNKALDEFYHNKNEL